MHLGRLESAGGLGRVGQSLGLEPKQWWWASLWVWGPLGCQGSFPWTYNNEALAVLEGPLQGLCSGGVAWGPQAPGACLPVVSVVNHRGKIFILLILWLPRVEMQKSGPAQHRLIITQMLTMKIVRIDVCITGWGLSPADTMRVWWPN